MSHVNRYHLLPCNTRLTCTALKFHQPESVAIAHLFSISGKSKQVLQQQVVSSSSSSLLMSPIFLQVSTMLSTSANTSHSSSSDTLLRQTSAVGAIKRQYSGFVRFVNVYFRPQVASLLSRVHTNRLCEQVADVGHTIRLL
jgi:hypothetical protein